MTLFSMTGFGLAQGELSPRLSAQIAIRSVNHRYRDIQIHFTGRDEGPEIESIVRKSVESWAKRGRVSVQVDLRWIAAPSTSILVDEKALRAILGQLSPIGDIRAGDILSIPGFVTLQTESHAMNQHELGSLKDLVGRACADFQQMREEEALQLLLQIEKDLDALDAFGGWIEPQLPEFRNKHLDRLRERLGEVLQDTPVDENRTLQEAAIQADKADVAEEFVRLKTHLGAFRSRLSEGGTVGRALDFLCQEVHREINTLGTKCREFGVTGRVVDAKGAIERIREQVQNLE